MFPKINPRDMQKMMKRLGVKETAIDATEVIIKTSDKDLIIKNPKVTKVNMMGQESIQIIGDIEEAMFTEDDIRTVMEQTNCTEKKAKEALEKEGDIAAAILALKHKKA